MAEPMSELLARASASLLIHHMDSDGMTHEERVEFMTTALLVFSHAITHEEGHARNHRLRDRIDARKAATVKPVCDWHLDGCPEGAHNG